MKMKTIIGGIALTLFGFSGLKAQFAPSAGQNGSTAIHQDSNVFVGWANICTVERGWVDISDTTLFRASAGGPPEVIGKATGIGIMSLGDYGAATVSFDFPLKNGPGFDLAVFENGLNDTYLELAFVEVSSDGENFVRFPAVSHTDTTVQIDNWGGIQATDIHNLAGKYRIGFGTPFDLSELENEPGLDVMNITHVRLVDVVGSMQNAYAQRDSEGNKINDPWPTPWPTGGFDLDAVGAIQWNGPPTGVGSLASATEISLYPNPVQAGTSVNIALLKNTFVRLEVLDGLGRLEASIDLTNREFVQFDPTSKGIYGFRFTDSEGGAKTAKLVVW